MHYIHGQSYIYSVSEWIAYCITFGKLIKIKLFANFKTQNLFKLWRKYLLKTKRIYYIKKLSMRFHRHDVNLLMGIFGVRKVLKEMQKVDIFEVEFKFNYISLSQNRQLPLITSKSFICRKFSN